MAIIMVKAKVARVMAPIMYSIWLREGEDTEIQRTTSGEEEALSWCVFATFVPQKYPVMLLLAVLGVLLPILLTVIGEFAFLSALIMVNESLNPNYYFVIP